MKIKHVPSLGEKSPQCREGKTDEAAVRTSLGWIFAADREASGVRRLKVYQSLFPGFEEAVAAEFNALSKKDDGSVVLSAVRIRAANSLEDVEQVPGGECLWIQLVFYGCGNTPYQCPDPFSTVSLQSSHPDIVPLPATMFAGQKIVAATHPIHNAALVTIEATWNGVARSDTVRVMNCIKSVPDTPLVHFLYIVPDDKSFNPAYYQAIEKAARHIQIWYADQLGGRTFSLACPLVMPFATEHNSSWYSAHNRHGVDTFFDNVAADGLDFVHGNFGDPNHRWIFYIDAMADCDLSSGAGRDGVAVMGINDLLGLAGEPLCLACPAVAAETVFDEFRWVGGLGHELGHAFKLEHPVVNDASLMGDGFRAYPATFLRADDINKLQNDSKISQFFTPQNFCAGAFFDVRNPLPG